MTPCYYCEADDDACKICIHSDTYIDPQEEITKLREQVAAQAEVIEKLRDALAYCASDLRPEMQSRQVVATNALAIPTDSTQILDEVRREEREKCAKVLDERYVDLFEPEIKEAAAAIRAME